MWRLWKGWAGGLVERIKVVTCAAEKFGAIFRGPTNWRANKGMCGGSGDGTHRNAQRRERVHASAEHDRSVEAQRRLARSAYRLTWERPLLPWSQLPREENMPPPRCNHVGCMKYPSHGRKVSYHQTTADFCSQHAKDGTVSVHGKRCARQRCTTRPSYGEEDTKAAEFCSEHAKDGMVNIRRKRCAHQDCTKITSSAWRAQKRRSSALSTLKMARRTSGQQKCIHLGCNTRPSYGMEGTRTASFCSRPTRDSIVNVGNKKCAKQGCTIHPSYGLEGTNTAEFTAQHRKGGMVSVLARGEERAHPGCTTRPADAKEGAGWHGGCQKQQMCPPRMH